MERWELFSSFLCSLISVATPLMVLPERATGSCVTFVISVGQSEERPALPSLLEQVVLVNAQFSQSDLGSLSLEHIPVTSATGLDSPVSCSVTAAVSSVPAPDGPSSFMRALVQ